MDFELLLIVIIIGAIGIVAVWRDPRAAGQIIVDILSQFKRKKDNEIKRNDEDDNGNPL